MQRVLTNKRIMLTALLTATSFSNVHAMDELAERVAPSNSERRSELSSDSDTPAALPTAPRVGAYDSDEEVTLPLTSEQLTGEAYFHTIEDAWNTVRWPLTYTLFRDPNAEVRFTIQDILAHEKTDPLAAKLIIVIREEGKLPICELSGDPLRKLKCTITLVGARQSFVKYVASMSKEEIARAYEWSIKSELTAAIVWPANHDLFSDNTADTVVVTIPQLLSNITPNEFDRIKDPLAKKVVNHAGTVVKRRLTIQPSDAGAGYGGYERTPASMMRRRGDDEVNTDYLKHLNPDATFTVRVADACLAICADDEPDLSYLDDQIAEAITIPEKAREAVELAQTAGVFGDLEISEYPTDKALAKTLLSRVHGLIAKKAASQEADISALRASSSLLHDARTALEGELSAANAAHDATKASLAAKDNEAFQAKCNLTIARQDITMLNCRNVTLTAERDGAEALLATKTSEVASLTLKLSSLTAEHADLTAKFDAATATLRTVALARAAFLDATAAAFPAATDGASAASAV